KSPEKNGRSKQNDSGRNWHKNRIGSPQDSQRNYDRSADARRRCSPEELGGGNEAPQFADAPYARRADPGIQSARARKAGPVRQSARNLAASFFGQRTAGFSARRH